ncbi:putative flavoprotein involved in K+ transport [Nocardioides zeae]|uniref:Flavoprotein involved in K+ transport n=1 Tax=Nocardioides zeae TaxID=1457234 RepID=A0ACC6IDZ4_9ACTN|nr:NAD(P)/FAD-dependent oxidoreductase [Nocardioides zeae]MDR6174178.1 putative flavoprotein involved in K+ transport [Nocardioides zeae]MDR6208985.1 putative flavoprotein involved in K+ transport [Nocardioides zeae]
MTHAAATTDTVAGWLTSFETALRSEDAADAVAAVFHEECWWRDLVVLSWNLVTVEGHAGVRELVAHTARDAAPRDFTLLTEVTATPAPDNVTQGWFRFTTSTATGRGFVRLRGGRAWTLLTAVDELVGHEEAVGVRRPLGAEHGADPGRVSWVEQREQESREFASGRAPYTLVVGGGQSGVALAARLRRLGVPTLVVDSREKPGDTWRSRYRSLCLHDPVWYDHLPYLPFPPSWPVYTPKDKIGGWIESYVEAMEICFWGSTTCRSAEWDEDAERWTVVLDRAGERIELQPSQLVIATGISGRPQVPVIDGQDVFAGRQEHSSEHSGEGDFSGTRVVVVGANNSAHDIAAAMWENGAEVTMVQRSSTLIVTADSLRWLQRGLYSEEALAAGIDTEQADLLSAATPYRLVPSMSVPAWNHIRERDADLYARLEEVGFRVDFGVDGSGLGMKYLTRAGGYYVDVGASELVASKQIGLASGEVVELTADSVVLSDGRHLPADLVVYATGFGPFRDTLADLVGPEVADRVGPVWGLGSGRPLDPGPWEGELRNVYKPTAQPNLWIQAGNLMQSRFYSKYLAAQLKARFEGLPVRVYRPSALAVGAAAAAEG